MMDMNTLQAPVVAAQDDLKQLCYCRVGGRARHFIRAHDVGQIRRELATAAKNSGTFYILGNGSNILIPDGGIDRPVIKLGEEFQYIRQIEAEIIEVGAATLLSQMTRYCIQHSLSGIENLSGIPATAGGLLAMNASSYGRDIGSSLVQAVVMDARGQLLCLRRRQIAMGYRFSSLRNKVIINAWLALSKSRLVRDTTAFYLKRRLDSQDYRFPGWGCIFKNPPSVSAAMLIEGCGLKGFVVGGAAVSCVHANFIVNKADARASDVDYLIGIIKERVRQKYAISLEEEIIRWSP